ncbi:MAG TPA: NAD-dependent epimerase/dehydratase family protein [Candidatus Acidoferrum sp.]|jgi:UDP-glucose 4-epimerase|nr:NAD-dependent epimerase/dehydratase family protein [Candidatus Acidoferrum sp.]
MPSKKRRVLVTGVARWWGALVVQRLVEDPDVAEVIGIDIREPRYDLGRADYLQLDIRHSLIGKLVRSVGIDTVVHTLTRVDSFDLDPRRAHEVNVIGTLNLLAGCAGVGSPVTRFILKSSSHVYGSRPDLPTPIREDHRLDSNSRHQFVRDIVEVESYVNDFAARNAAIDILVLRFGNSLNADEPQPLARYLDLEVVPTIAGYDPAFQLTHRDDCVEAMRLAVKRGPAGAYNIAAPGAEPLSKLLDDAGKLHAPLIPPFGVELAAFALRKSGVASLSPQLLDLLRWGRVLSTGKAARLLGFRAARDTKAAFEEYISQRRVLRYTPDNQGYQYEKELEDFIHSRAPSVENGEVGENGENRSSPLAGEVAGGGVVSGPFRARKAGARPPRHPRR